MKFQITKDLVFDFLDLALSLHEHVIEVCNQHFYQYRDLQYMYQYRDVDVPILELNSYIRIIDGETILEYVPPQEHILILK